MEGVRNGVRRERPGRVKGLYTLRESTRVVQPWKAMRVSSGKQ